MSNPIDWRSCGVRLAVPADEVGLFDLLRTRHAEEGRGEFDADFALRVLRRVLGQEDGAIGALIAGPVRIEAAIGVVSVEPFDSTIRDLQAVWHYVHPEHRRSGHRGTALIAFAKDVAVLRKMTLKSDLPLVSAPKGRVEAYQKSYGPIRGHSFVFDPMALTA